MDDLEGHRLARPAAAVQGGPRVPQPEVQPSAAHRPLPRQRPALRRRAGGRAYSFANKPDAKADLFFDLQKELKTIDKLPGAKDVDELYGLVFHPNSRRTATASSATPCSAEGRRRTTASTDGTRVSRFTVTKTDPPRIDPASEEIVLTFLQGGHNGGDLHFGPDGMLYISTGDAASPNPPDPLNTGQDFSDLLSSILRIDVDTKDAGKNYAVPKDNPFVGMKDVRPEIWAYGFRNPWRMSFDRKTGELLVGDVGWELWEMVHRIEKGGNYGWSIVGGAAADQAGPEVGPTPIRPPLIELPHTIAAASPAATSTAARSSPSWSARTSSATGRRGASGPPASRATGSRRCRRSPSRPCASSPSARTTTASCTSSTTTPARSTRSSATTPAAANADFPTKLSETGLFASVKEHTPAAGVIPFASNAGSGRTGPRPSTSSRCRARRASRFFDEAAAAPGQVYWHNFRMHFPKDAVLVEDALAVSAEGKDDSGSRRSCSTSTAWTGAATPSPGATTSPTPTSSPPTAREKEFHVPTDRRDSAPAGEARAGVEVPQPQPVHVVPQRVVGVRAGVQRAAVEPRPVGGEHERTSSCGSRRKGYVRRVGRTGQAAAAVRRGAGCEGAELADRRQRRSRWTSERRELPARQLRPLPPFGGGGGQVVLELDFTKPLKETASSTRRPRQATSACRTRGSSSRATRRSTLFFRMAKFGRDRMPHLGSECPDEAGWTWSATGSRRSTNPPSGVDHAAADRRRGVERMRSCRRRRGASPVRGRACGEFDERHAAMLAAAAKLPPGPVRDLFEGYLPPDPKGRKLGSNPRPAAILALDGDARRARSCSSRRT